MGTEIQRREVGVRAGFYEKNPFKQQKKLLLVLETAVAGLNHHVPLHLDEGKKIMEKLTPGTELLLFRDPENKHDKWAISVYSQEEEELGYVTRFKNETIARLMDLGKKFVAYVDEPKELPEDPTERRRTVAPTEDYDLPFSIYLVEK